MASNSMVDSSQAGAVGSAAGEDPVALAFFRSGSNVAVILISAGSHHGSEGLLPRPAHGESREVPASCSSESLLNGFPRGFSFLSWVEHLQSDKANVAARESKDRSISPTSTGGEGKGVGVMNDTGNQSTEPATIKKQSK